VEIRHLKSFIAVAEELHFTRAASKIHMTQSALSDQIQKLELDVGVRLLTRTSRQVALTAAGTELRDRARAILLDIDAARTAAQQASLGRLGTLSVGYSMLASQSVLPHAVERTFEESPGIRLQLHEAKTGPQLEGLRSGDLDVALIFGRPPAMGLSVRKLHGVEIVAVVNRHDPLARGGPIRFSELARRSCVLCERAQSPMMYDAIVNGAGRAGFSLNVAETVDDPCATLLMIKLRGLVGFTSCTETGVVRATPGIGRATVVSLVEPTPALELYAAWRSDEENPAVHDFVGHLATSTTVHTPASDHAGASGSRSSTVTRLTQ